MRIRPFLAHAAQTGALVSALALTPLLPACDDGDSDTPVSVNPGGTRYAETVFSDVAVTRAVEYGSNLTQNGESQRLSLNFYEPAEDTATSRPLIVYAFGGGFQTGEREEAEDSFVPFFVGSGYTMASIDYRVIDLPADQIGQDQSLIGIYDAVADMRAAIRFLKANAEQYRLDTANIFLTGYSAGAITALHCAYLNDVSEIEDFQSAALNEHADSRGGLQGDSGGAPGDYLPVKGALSFAGTLGYAELIDAGEAALYSAHGTADSTVPYGAGLSQDGPVSLNTEGPSLLHPRAESLGLVHASDSIADGDHGAPALCQTCLENARAFLFGLL